MMVSVDGYFEGEGHDLSWHNVDAEFNEFAIAQTKSVGTLLFGKRTYDLMAGYWPMAEARKDDPVVAGLMNTTPKIVFSKSMQKLQAIPHWENVELAREVDHQAISKMKNQAGRDLAIFGSNQLCVSFIKLGLVDEFRLIVNPVSIGKGTPLFAGLNERYKLKLIDEKKFNSGNILLTYEPKN